ASRSDHRAAVSDADAALVVLSASGRAHRSRSRLMTPFDRLAELATGRPSAETVAWLAVRAERYLDGEADSLDRAFGVVGRADHAVRDAHLVRAAELIDAPRPSTRAKVEALRPVLSHFAAAVWPRYRDLDVPPPQWSALRRELFFAFRAAGGGVPTGDRQLREIVGQRSTCDCPVSPAE